MAYLKETSILSPLTAFGDLSTAENNAYIQSSPYYEFMPANFREYNDGTASSTGITDRMFTVANGTDVGGYGAIQSFRSLNYKPGQGGLTRFTAVFPSSVASHWSGVGLVNLSDELSFGYENTTFGIWYRKDGVAECRTIAVTATDLGNLTLTLNSVAYVITLSNSTTDTNAWEIATWLNANQSVWYAEQIGSDVIIIAESDGAKSGTYSFVHAAAATGTITQNKAGVTKTSTHIPQSNWNRSTMSSLDPTTGNVYQIQYQYLGFGAVFFSVENPNTGRFDLVHVIEYANTETTPSLRQPSLRFGLYSASTGTTTSVSVQCASTSCYVQGTINRTRNPRAVKFTQSVSTTLTNVLTLRNRKMYNYLMNQVEVNPLAISISSESSKNVEVELRANATLSGATNYSNAGTNLVTDVNTVSSTVSGGTLLASFTIGANGSQTINLKDYEIALPPTLSLCVAAKVNSGAASNVTVSLTYYEDL